MIYTDLTKKALELSFQTHKNQRDKSGAPYVYHPFHLAEQMKDEYSTCAALLHDVVEDSKDSDNPVTLNDLRLMEFPDEVVDAIALMTHEKSVPYMDYVKKIKSNPIARKVKLADLKHNSDTSRLSGPADEKTEERLAKYRAAIKLLEQIDYEKIGPEVEGEPNLHVFTPEEKEAMFEKLTDAILTDNKAEYDRLLKIYPLSLAACRSLKRQIGIEALKTSGWNLSEAVQEYGPEWLEK